MGQLLGPRFCDSFFVADQGFELLLFLCQFAWGTGAIVPEGLHDLGASVFYDFHLLAGQFIFPGVDAREHDGLGQVSPKPGILGSRLLGGVGDMVFQHAGKKGDVEEGASTFQLCLGLEHEVFIPHGDQWKCPGKIQYACVVVGPFQGGSMGRLRSPWRATCAVPYCAWISDEVDEGGVLESVSEFLCDVQVVRGFAEDAGFLPVVITCAHVGQSDGDSQHIFRQFSGFQLFANVFGVDGFALGQKRAWAEVCIGRHCLEQLVPQRFRQFHESLAGQRWVGAMELRVLSGQHGLGLVGSVALGRQHEDSGGGIEAHGRKGG